jgi:hypothetical protein
MNLRFIVAGNLIADFQAANITDDARPHYA